MSAVTDPIGRHRGKLYKCAYHDHEQPHPRPGSQRQRISFPIKHKPGRLLTSPKRRDVPRAGALEFFQIAKWCIGNLQPGARGVWEARKFKVNNIIQLWRTDKSLPVLKGMVTRKEFFYFTIIHGSQSEDICYLEILHASVIWLEEALKLWRKLQSKFFTLDKPILHPVCTFEESLLLILFRAKHFQQLDIKLLTATGGHGGKAATGGHGGKAATGGHGGKAAAGVEKLDLRVGGYRTEDGKPLVLNVVKKAEQILVNDRSRVKEYLPITGLAEFNKLSAKLIFGAESPAIRENRITTVCLSGTGSLRVGGEFLAKHYHQNNLRRQVCLSGTGSLRVGGEFLAKHYHQRTIYIPQPTGEKYIKVFQLAGLSLKYYRYYDPKTCGLDLQGLLEDLSSAPSGAIVLLHACAHNPTGVDPTLGQWEQIRKLMRSKALFPFFDCAYQGFASGSLDGDAQSIRMFVSDGGECFAAQSYANNMGLYAECVGALNIVCKSSDVVSRFESQLELVLRAMYSNSPVHGPSIVATILKDRELYNEWNVELKAMAYRIISVRQQLFDALRVRGTPGGWSHIIEQIGMLTFTGLKKDQVAFIRREYHIYMTSDGKISMAGLSSRTVPRLADAIHAAVTRMG